MDLIKSDSPDSLVRPRTTQFAISAYFVVCLSSIFSSSNVSAQTLKEAMSGAFAIDPTLRSASFNKDAAGENVALARSRLLPQVNLQGSDQQLTQTTTQDSVAGPLSRTFSGPSKNYQLVMRQALLRPRDMAGLDVANAQKENGEFKYLSELADSRIRAASAWLDVLAALKVLTTYELTLLPYEKAAEQEQNRFKSGDGTRDSVLEAKAQLESAKSMVNEARLNLAAKQKVFTLATGLELDLSGKVALPQMRQTFLNGLDRQQFWERITQSSSDLQAARAMERAQQARLRQSERDHLPTADLVASYNQAQNDATSTQGIRYQNRQVGVQFNVPIYAGGGISAAQRQQLAIYEASVSDRMSLELRMEQDFLNNWVTQQSQVDRIHAAGMLLDASLDQLQGAKKGLALGLKTWGDVAQVQSAVARRTSDQVNNWVTLYRTQLRILRMLSADDPYWDQWTDLFNMESIKTAAKN